jgi:hypothetical protein
LSVELRALDVVGFDAVTAVAPPVITSQPGNQSIAYNTTATLSVTATSSSTPTYQWYKGASGDTSSPVGSNSTTYTTPPLITNTKYWVRVSNAGGSVDSTTALVTVLFTDPTLAPGTTTIAAAHFNELRARINAQRARYSYSAYAYTHTITAMVTTITAADILEMRSALSQPYASQTGGPPMFATTATVGSLITAANVQELRDLVTYLENH